MLYVPVVQLRYQALAERVILKLEQIAALKSPVGRMLTLNVALVTKCLLELRDRLGALVFYTFQLFCDAAGVYTFVTRPVSYEDAHFCGTAEEYEESFRRSVQDIYEALYELNVDTALKGSSSLVLVFGVLKTPCLLSAVLYFGTACYLLGWNVALYHMVSAFCFYGALAHPLLALWLGFHVTGFEGEGECFSTGRQLQQSALVMCHARMQGRSWHRYSTYTPLTWDFIRSITTFRMCRGTNCPSFAN